jgi:hypothetical protein
VKLSTLVFLAGLAFAGLFVAHNAHGWINSLHREKAHLTASLKNRLSNEASRVQTDLTKRLNSEETRARTALRERLAKEKARAETARKAARSTTPATPAAPSPPKNLEATTSGMSDAEFWQLISETRSAAGNDSGKQSDLLKERLTQLSPQAIIGFAKIRSRLDERAYTWNLWGAAYVIEDGCSDDCFRNFRAYLISLGQGPYENALKNPDSLASVAQDAETGNWENADNVAPDAYSSVTGNDFPLDSSDLSGSPAGTPFNENDTAGLAQRYPKLAARFR